MIEVTIWEIIEIIMPLSALLAFLGTIIAIYYTRKNMKTTKYIDTITSERIKWLELIRQDISILCSELIVLFTNAKQGIFLLKQQEQLLSRLSKPIEELDKDDYPRKMHSENKEKINEIKKNIRNKEKHIQLIKQINIIILRLNPIEDKSIIDRLKILKITIQEEKFTSDNVEQCLEITEWIIEKAQNMFKAEWEKVKKETLKGSKL